MSGPRAAATAPGEGVVWRTRTALGLEAVGAVATVTSVIALVETCRRLLAGGASESGLLRLVLAAAGAAAAGLVVQTAGRALSREAAVRSQEFHRAAVASRLRGDPVARLLHASWRERGTALGRDVVAVGLMAGRAGSELMSAVLLSVLSIGYLFWVDWGMALVTLTPILLGFVTFGVISARFFRDMKDDYEASIGALDVVGPRIGLDARINRAGSRARTAAEAKTSARRLADATDEFSGFFIARIGTLLGGRALAEIAFSPLTVLVFVLVAGVPMVRAGWLPPADLVPFVLVGAGLAAPLLAITYAVEEVGEGKKATAQLTGFVSGGPVVPGGEIPFELPERGVLTVTEPDPGAAGRLIDQVAAVVPPERFAAVGAEPAVVVGPVLAYITADRPDRGADAAERAARTAGVHDAVSALPRGYASVVGDDASLSRPELQRIALARVLAGDRDVVLLDERAFPGDPDVLRAAVEDLRERAAVVVVSAGPSGDTAGDFALANASRPAQSAAPSGETSR
ncbi:hypothetical protein ACFVS9_08690 [Streptomyces sp. NPDC058008]|uniref:hypothetical protein n=1 Tax=Streptomyces sp. NPDC058008 TaxID=3346303 RepID=UPI0036E55AA4